MAATVNNSELAIHEGLLISKELIDMAVEHLNGIYLISPFLSYDLTVELSKYIQVKTTALEELQKQPI